MKQSNRQLSEDNDMSQTTSAVPGGNPQDPKRPAASTPATPTGQPPKPVAPAP